MNTNFFDDYILISEEALCNSTSQAFESFLDLSGWRFGERYIRRVRNTEGRRQESVDEIGAILEDRRLGRAKALQLRGRLGFAENQLFGRLGRQSMHVLVEYAYLGGGDFDHRRIGLALNTPKT